MFISDRLIFLELQKTGCTHIRNLLMTVTDGRIEGKHNKASPHLLSTERFFLGSVRDPWEWYVSLWAYGCDRRGGLFEVATAGRSFRGHGWMSNPARAARQFTRDLRRRPDEWMSCYTDADDAQAFRRWLRLVLHGPLPGGILKYGAPTITRFAGLLTYRYVHLFCRSPFEDRSLSEITSLDELIAYERRACFIDYFIRNESLEEGLIAALRAAGIQLTDSDQERIQAGEKTNTSSRRRPTSYFYTPETVEWVGRSDRLIVEKFRYQAPTLD
jgi:hypothetical protein